MASLDQALEYHGRAKKQTHDGAAADDAEEDDESVVVEVFAQHEHAGIGVVGVALAAVAGASRTRQGRIGEWIRMSRASEASLFFVRVFSRKKIL